jgi:hypothetical protein
MSLSTMVVPSGNSLGLTKSAGICAAVSHFKRLSCASSAY